MLTKTRPCNPRFLKVEFCIFELNHLSGADQLIGGAARGAAAGQSLLSPRASSCLRTFASSLARVFLVNILLAAAPPSTFRLKASCIVFE
jgi:hypothetical protein